MDSNSMDNNLHGILWKRWADRIDDPTMCIFFFLKIKLQNYSDNNGEMAKKPNISTEKSQCIY